MLACFAQFSRPFEVSLVGITDHFPWRRRMNQSRGIFSNVTCGGMALILLLALAACGGPPKWVKQGSGAYNDKDTKAFYGVGAVTGVRNEPLAWDTPAHRARP